MLQGFSTTSISHQWPILTRSLAHGTPRGYVVYIANEATNNNTTRPARPTESQGETDNRLSPTSLPHNSLIPRVSGNSQDWVTTQLETYLATGTRQ